MGEAGSAVAEMKEKAEQLQVGAGWAALRRHGAALAAAWRPGAGC